MRDTTAIVTGLVQGVKEYFTLKLLPSVIVPVFGFFFGLGTEKLMLGLVTLIVMDFVTGVIAAKKLGHPIQSRNAVKSAYKIAVYGLLVSAGHITEVIVPLTTYIEEVVMTFLALTELISIVENVGRMGFAIPQRLLNQLYKWREGETVLYADRRVGEDRRATSVNIEDDFVAPIS